MPSHPAELAPHKLSVALIAPEIAPNTGNIARLCVATGTHLHLVRPLGFVLSDKQLRRSAMDYWDRLALPIHDDFPAFLSTIAQPATTLWLMSSKGQTSLWDAPFADGDCLVFGSETRGLPASLLEQYPSRTVRIPQAPGERCLNLSTSAGIALFEALRRIQSPK